MSRRTRLPHEQRRALRISQREAAGASVMSGVCDNYLTAFAIHLNATAQQIAWVTAIPQLLGAWAQLVSVCLAGRGPVRMRIIVGGATFQAACVAALMALGFAPLESAVTLLVVIAVLYQVGGNVVQPQWRAVMVLLVPERRRGRYFARRLRITAVTSFGALAAGGLLLHACAALGWTAGGFALLFAAALVGRMASVRDLGRLVDPDGAVQAERPGLAGVRAARRAIAEPEFRRFTLFVAWMYGAVAMAGPFFSVHMLRNLGFSYLEFMASLAASIVMQFLTLTSWGHISDHLGNRVVLVATAFVIPLLPALWIVSGNFWYLLAVQALGGLAWGGFSLSSSNYLYDLQPAGGELATFAAVQAIVTGTAVFAGAMLGGYMATHLPLAFDFGGMELRFENALYAVFAVSALLRLAVALWFTPHVVEIRLSRRVTVNEMIYRFARFNPITGVVMDLLDAVRPVNGAREAAPDKARVEDPP